MKKTIYLISFLLLIAQPGFAQKKDVLNGYKYIYVPTLTYNNGSLDIWGISSSLSNYFSNKGFGILNEKVTSNSETNYDPCIIIWCEINHSNVTRIGHNKVTITLKNCKQELVYSNTSSGIGSTMQDDFNKALKKLYKELDDLKYQFNAQLTPELIFPKVETTTETESSVKSYFDKNKLNPIEGIYKSYQSQFMGYYKIAIKKRDNQYIAIVLESEKKSWNPGEIKAYFEPSSMNGFYAVKWYMGDKLPFETFGVMDNESFLTLEFKDEQGKFQDKFIKMYPATDDKGISKKSTGASGSGFFVTPAGLIATNAHVVADAKTIVVSLSNDVGNFTYKAKIVLNDSKNDVALIQIDDEKFKGLSFLPYGISEKADIGEKAFTIGYPLNDIMGTNYKVNDGIISAKSGINDDVRYYQISVPLQPGNSGGPLFNKDGNVIGITSAKLSSKAVGTLIENVNYAVKATYLASLINMMPNTSLPTPTSKLVGKELQEQVKVLKNYVCIIQVN